jgi:hypothetical protein
MRYAGSARYLVILEHRLGIHTQRDPTLVPGDICNNEAACEYRGAADQEE